MTTSRTSPADLLTDFELFKAVKSYGWLLDLDAQGMVDNDWEGFQFVGMDLSEWSFSGSTFKDCVFAKCLMSGLHTASTDFKGGYIDCVFRGLDYTLCEVAACPEGTKTWGPYSMVDRPPQDWRKS